MSKSDKPIDWAGIERDYRAGVMSNREMARWYGISETAIRKKAKAEAWERVKKPAHVERRSITAEIIPPAKASTEALPDRARGIAGRLMDELEAVTAHHGELEDMICAEESDPRRRQALLKAISLPERAMTLKNLSTTLKTLNETAAPAGKKEQRQQAAENVAGGGKFAPRSGPRLAVNNG